MIGVVSGFRLLNSYELLAYDLRFHLKPPQSTAKDIVIIDIDDQTLETLGRWPLPRDFHASLIDVLNEFGAKSIIFDFVFSEPMESDHLFAESIKNAGNIYLPLVFYIEASQKKNYFLLEDHEILADIAESLKSSAHGIGHINTPVDSDGKTRRIPLFTRYHQKLVPQLALKVACDFLGVKASKVEFKGDKVILSNKLALPVSNNNELMVNYPGRWDKSFTRFSYLQILTAYKNSKERKPSSIDLKLLKNKICFVGLTAAGTTDSGPVPLENNYYKVGVHASVLNSIIQNKFIRDVGMTVNTVINLIIFCAALWICFNGTPLKAFLGSLGLGLTYFILSVFLFNNCGIWIDLFFPLLLVVVSYVGSTSFRFLQEIRKRELLEKELEIAQTIQQQFLPKKIQGDDGLLVAAYMQPAKFVAGDLYDVVKISDNKMGFLLGDVAGKGVPASLLMAQTISLFRIFARQETDCKEVLGLLNKELCGKAAGRFVTALYLMVDFESHKAVLSSAGQGPLFVYRKKEDKVVDVELEGNVPLGLMSTINYTNVYLDIEKGDRIILFSDGLSEARNTKGEEFGYDHIKATLLQNAGNSVEKTLESFKQEVSLFVERAEQHDDITVLIIAVEK